MARKLRVEYPGAIYHVMNRGDHRDAIFRSDQDRELFLKTLGEASQKTDWQVHACVSVNPPFEKGPDPRIRIGIRRGPHVTLDP